MINYYVFNKERRCFSRENVKLGKEMEILCFFLAVYSVANNWHFEW